MARGLLDTSVFIALESGRSIEIEKLPEESLISPVTLGELQAGVLATSDYEGRSRRLRTLNAASGVELLPVEEPVAEAWALLRVHVRETGRRAGVNDLWIAATALANRIPLYTQDNDFDVLDGVSGLTVVKL